MMPTLTARANARDDVDVERLPLEVLFSDIPVGRRSQFAKELETNSNFEFAFEGKGFDLHSTHIIQHLAYLARAALPDQLKVGVMSGGYFHILSDYYLGGWLHLVAPDEQPSDDRATSSSSTATAPRSRTLCSGATSRLPRHNYAITHAFNEATPTP